MFGNRSQIDLSASNFRQFIEKGNLYIDKTKFIENVLKEASSVLLFTRPRRTGKSLNMNMLKVFLDCKEESSCLFKDLYIEKSSFFASINSYPVVFLDFKNIRISNHENQFKKMIYECAEYYLERDEMSRNLILFLDNHNDNDTSVISTLCRDIYAKYKVKPFIIIDEYDKILMDNMFSKDYEKLRVWITEILESALKGNDYLEKAVMTGVARISKESLLSGLNNLVVYDIFTQGVYDIDFSLSEEEAKELLTPEELQEVCDWYNNIRVGNHKLYNIFSVLSYLHFGRIDNYWGRSGTMNLLINLLNKRRANELAQLVSSVDNKIKTRLEPRLSIHDLIKNDSGIYYYSLAVQSGYLTYDEVPDEIGQYTVYVPDLELQKVWQDFVLGNIVRESGNELKDIFENIHSIEAFSSRLKSFIDYQLSYFDFDRELEKTYHVFVFGMVLAAGYKCSSNLESGLGRYDLMICGDTFNAIIEFKKAYTDKEMEMKAMEAIEQIENNRYYENVTNKLPIYKIGIGCFGKQCFVVAV